MAALADSFLDDLEDLGEESEDEIEEKEVESAEEKTEVPSEFDELLRRIQSRNLAAVAALRRSSRFTTHMQAIEEAMNRTDRSFAQSSGPLETDPDYKLIVASNKLIQDIEEEIINVHRYVAEIYASKFPELEQLVPNRIDYVKTVQRIGNETDITMVELNDLLPSATVMVVSVTASTTSGTPLSEQDLQECLRGCEEVLALHEAKGQLLRFVESRMNLIAPNLSALVGTHIAAQLMGMAGGLVPLSKIPACNIQVMGQEKRALYGYSGLVAMKHMGILQYADVVQQTPPNDRRKALKVLAGKVILAVRVDTYENQPDNSVGLRLRREVSEKFEKWQEPQKARTKKALPIPDEKPRTKRGGKRVRRWKERMAMTEMRMLANKRSFETGGGEYGDEAMGVDFGMLDQETSGRLRAPVKKQQSHVTKKQRVANVSSGATNGLASSLVFTPVQGLELVNPHAAADKVKEANAKWFSNTSGFMSAKPK